MSDLALTEMASALGRRTREQRLTPEAARRLYREASKLHAASRHAELTPPIHRRAERMMLSLAVAWPVAPGARRGANFVNARCFVNLA